MKDSDALRRLGTFCYVQLADFISKNLPVHIPFACNDFNSGESTLCKNVIRTQSFNIFGLPLNYIF